MTGPVGPVRHGDHMNPHTPDCDQDPHEVYSDGTRRYCGICGALLAIWPEDSDRGWEEVA